MNKPWFVLLVIGVAAAFAYVAPAGAIGLTSFSMSPTSGPPGTTVYVSGGGCSPGLVLQPSQDFVEVAAGTAVPTTLKLPVSANGSWSGSFVVPSNASASPATVTPLCFSDELQSLLTIYTPQVFTVTAPQAGPPTTTPPTTVGSGGDGGGGGSGGGGTTPGTTTGGGSGGGSGGGGGNKGGGSGGGGGSTPGGGGGSTPGGSSGGGAGSSGGSGTGSAGSVGGAPGNAGSGTSAGSKGGTANLASPSLAVDRSSTKSGGLSWLVWLLIALAIATAAALLVWFEWERRHRVAPAAETETDNA